MTEKGKVLADDLYQASDAQLVSERLKARKLVKINNSDQEDTESRVSLD
ncbi:maltose acetyltransferase domain-containing protein [Algoriphagus sp. D3-2-R+10]|nr:maltose acetyltransferase domain-containing protein [Algoriphagus sp. D3-2-R+10]MEB2774095.1 maltose acetyltransferase domain-containing protein [Algoriphagus sp. D3-2-R+10]